MPRSVFVSFVFEDRVHFQSVQRWANEKRLGNDVVVTCETMDVRPQGEAAICAHLQPKIRGAACVLLLLGQNTHSHEWVGYELSVAASLGKKIIVTRIPGATGTAPPAFAHLLPVGFEPAALARALA